MLSLLFVVLSANLDVISGFSYHAGPLSYSNAKTFCETQGTHLATIVDDDDRLEALMAINQRDPAPWIGIEHEEPGPNGYPCHFTYPAEDPTVCPLYPNHWKCVDFWCDGGPTILTKGGYDCAVFYHEKRNKWGGIDNNVPCDEQRPFLCEEKPQICDTENFQCFTGIPVTICDNDGGIGGHICGCDMDGNGESRCVSGYMCGSTPDCNPINGNSDCPAGWVCITDTCCGQGTSQCTTLCGEDAPDTRRLITADESETPCDGFYCP